MWDPKYKKHWSTSSANEFGRLANGVGRCIKKSTNTIKFTRKKDVPISRSKDVTYGSFVCNVRNDKAENNRTRFVIGGNQINYPGEVETPTADMLVEKLLFNSAVSKRNAKFMNMDISNFYLMIPLKRPEYILISIKYISDEIINKYKLGKISDKNGSVYIKSNLVMYGLSQADLLANELLEKRQNNRGKEQSKFFPDLGKYDWIPVQFTLVVDDFGVKYVVEGRALHLKHTIEEKYTVTSEWDGQRYIGITIDWDYKRRQVQISMPRYVTNTIK